MKNYLVKSLFRVASPDWHVMNRGHETNMHANYEAMHNISLESHCRHLQGNWEYIFVNGDCEDINQAFEKTFWTIHQLWHQGPCNILYTDPDTVVTKAIDPWSEFGDFRMFNYTDPKQYRGTNQWSLQFDHFFNAGVRYFGHAMTEQTWKIGADMAQQWNHASYDTEQLILNQMLWSQPLTLQQALAPQWAYQAQWLPARPVALQDAWNGISIHDSAIVHVHGSRNSATKLQLMQELSQQGTI